MSLKSDLRFGVRIEGLQNFYKNWPKAPFLQHRKEVGPGDRIECLLEVYGKEIALLGESTVPSQLHEGNCVHCSPYLVPTLPPQNKTHLVLMHI